MSEHQHNHEGCDCIDPAECNCECHIIRAADALAKAASDLRGVEIGTSHWWAVEKNFHETLAAYEKVRRVL